MRFSGLAFGVLCFFVACDVPGPSIARAEPFPAGQAELEQTVKSLLAFQGTLEWKRKADGDQFLTGTACRQAKQARKEGAGPAAQTAPLAGIEAYANSKFAAPLLAEKQPIQTFYAVCFDVFVDETAFNIRTELEPAPAIVFGKPLLRALIALPNGSLKIGALFAHEAAHVFQSQIGANPLLQNKCGFALKSVELHADYLAGAYMAWWSASQNETNAHPERMFYRFGDTQMGSSNHHGTDRERFLAFATGYQDYLELAKSGPVDKLQLAAKGIVYATNGCR